MGQSRHPFQMMVILLPVNSRRPDQVRQPSVCNSEHLQPLLGLGLLHLLQFRLNLGRDHDNLADIKVNDMFEILQP